MGYRPNPERNRHREVMDGIRRDEDRLREMLHTMAVYSGVHDPKPVQDIPIPVDGMHISRDNSGIHMSGRVSEEVYKMVLEGQTRYNSIYYEAPRTRRKPLWHRLLWWAMRDSE